MNDRIINDRIINDDVYLLLVDNELVILTNNKKILPDTLVLDTLRLELTSGKAYLSGEDMILSQKEYLLLQLLIQQPEEILSEGTLYEKVWSMKLIEEDTSLKNAIYRLRKKLEGSGFTITTKRGEGYIFERE